MNKLPMGWVEVELGQLGSIHTGKTPSTKDKDNFGGDILFVKPADLDSGGYVYETADYLSEKGLEQLPNLPKNSIMVTCIGNLGKVGIATQTCATNQQINSIIPNENFVNYKFLYYQILTLKNWLEVNSSATTVSIINKSKFSKAPIYLPPKAEQDHIATLLDNHLSQVATISQKLNDILPIIKQFRQSVLAQAVSGKLLADLDFENWQKTTLNDLGSIHTGKTPSTKDKDNFGGDILFVKPADLDNGGYIHKTADYLSKKGLAQLPNLPKNSIMVTCIGNLGKVGITTQTCATNQQINSIIPNENLVHYKFLYYYVMTLKDWLQFNSSATTVSIINKSKFSKAPINLPPLAEQQQIVAEVERLFAVADSIETQVNAALARVENLTQSILHQAFIGNLSADWRACNADLITGEHSAAALLDTLKANAPNKTKKPKKSPPP